ncbi:hypothetical protein MSAN_01483600 [Mycena sanguinolenta]|uniref:Uncharacterized protein n=1 Tax=Mycena sanguinolenta TaxID=230812 RepID=A0A8H6Y9F8_9AGAR|nr:hypothetical protein MSAN_01483600 [Mycena sanguinolenta]
MTISGFQYQQAAGAYFVRVDQWRTLTEGQRAQAQKMLKDILALEETKEAQPDNRDWIKFGSIDLSNCIEDSGCATDEQESAPKEDHENLAIKSEGDLATVESQLGYMIMNFVADGDSDDDDDEQGTTLQDDYEMLQWGLQTAVKENNVDEALVELGRQFNIVAEQVGSDLRLDLDVPTAVHNMPSRAGEDKAAGEEDKPEVGNEASDNNEDKAAGAEDEEDSLAQEVSKLAQKMAKVELAKQEILEALRTQVAVWPADKQTNVIDRKERLDEPAEDLDDPINVSNATSAESEDKAAGEEDKQGSQAQDKSEPEIAADLAFGNLILKSFFPFFQWLMRTAAEENCVNEELLDIGRRINEAAENVGSELRLDMDDLSNNDPGEIRTIDDDAFEDEEEKELYFKIQDMSDEDIDKYALEFDGLQKEMEMCTTGKHWKGITRRMNELYEKIGSSIRLDLSNIDENKVLDKPVGLLRNE